MNAEPILCSGNDLARVCADIRARGGVVASLDTGVGGNAGYRVSFYERDAELAPHVAVRQCVDGTYCQQVSNPASLNPLYGGKTISPKTPSGAEDSRQTNGGEAQRTHPQDCTAVNPSIEDRIAALQDRLAASGKLRRCKPLTTTGHARSPYKDD